MGGERICWGLLVFLSEFHQFILWLSLWLNADRSSIARYLVESTRLPFAETERTLRVTGGTLPFQKLIETLAEVQGKSYDIVYLDPEEAERNETEARERGDEKAEMMWSIKPLAASGFGLVPGGNVDGWRFGWKPESVRETFERVYGDSR
jgi:hypothetical protein